MNKEKYISAEKLKQALLEKSFYPAIVARTIDELEGEELVSVTRCQFCKRWKPHSGFAKDSPTGHCFEHSVTTLKTDFCSYGDER